MENTADPPLTPQTLKKDEIVHSSPLNSSPLPAAPFFADAVLDLEEAHDIAETPELPPRPLVDRSLLKMPPLEVEGSNGENKTSFSRIHNSTIAMKRPKSPPRWPRDIPWAVAFVLIVPTLLIGTVCTQQQSSWPLAHAPLATASMSTLVCAALTALVLSRFLYYQDSNGRHQVSHAITTLSPVILVATTLILAVFILYIGGRARIAAAVPLYFCARNLLLFQRFASNSSDSGLAGASPSRRRINMNIHTSSTRQAFFQALVETALDILSRSLRRASFSRVLITLILLQSFVLWLWRWAILKSLGSWHLFLGVLFAGKWATGTVARMLTLLACGGVAGWFMDQMELIQQLAPRTQELGEHSDRGEGGQQPGYEVEEEDENDRNRMPEAYRTVDASVYQSVLDLDEDDALEDDFEEDDAFALEAPTATSARQSAAQRSTTAMSTHPRSTVKSILWTGLTTSFGSVAQCGLVGGIAQYLWSQVRKVEAAQDIIRRQTENGGFASMAIGSTRPNVFRRVVMAFLSMARGFVRRYSDLAMCHVAGYYKSYQRAAQDVATLVEESGVEPILDDDITTHMCACTGGAISVILVLITSFMVVNDNVDEWQVVVNILLSFYLSYTLMFTVMEPLRAAIKAFYVSFAQHPQSLSQAFPLIYHRLSRLAESSSSAYTTPPSSSPQTNMLIV